MRATAIALILAALLLLAGCIAIGNCSGRPECYKKTAVYYALIGDKKQAVSTCREIIKDPDISITMQDLEYNTCIIEVARTMLDKNICSNVEEHYNIPQGWPISNVKELCEKSVQQEELRQQSLLNPKEAYKHTCPAAVFIFSILPLSILFMRSYEK